MLIRTALCGALAWAASASAQCLPPPADRFVGVGPTGQDIESFAMAISRDGACMAGYITHVPASGANYSATSFRWTQAGGLVLIPTLATDWTSYPTAVNADGSLIIGASSPFQSPLHGWRYSQGQVESIVQVPENGVPYALTPDDSTMVGEATYCTWRIVNGGPLDCVNSVSAGRAVSADGTVIVGGPYRWSAADGLTYVPYAVMWDVSADGARAVGGREYPFYDACWWDAAGTVHPIQASISSSTASAMACDDAGTLIAGYGPNGAFVYTDAMGTLDLATVLSLQGADLSGWTLEHVSAVCADGSVLAGAGTHNGLHEAWVAKLGVLLATQPEEDRVVCGGAPVSFTATAVGGPLAWSWSKNGVPLSPDERVRVEPSADGRSCTLSFVTTLGTDSGSYRCAVSDGCTSIAGSAFNLYATSADFNGDGDIGTDADIAAFFSCLGGSCCQTCGSADFDGDGNLGTDQDIESFFRVLAGGPC